MTSNENDLNSPPEEDFDNSGSPGSLDDLDLDGDEPEFSLTQLSEAYAQVIEEQTGRRHIVDSLDSDQAAADDEAESQLSDSDSETICPISPESIVEAILFVGAPQGEKLTSRNVAEVMRDVSAADVTSIVKTLQKRYQDEDRAYRVNYEKGDFELVLDPALIDLQREFHGRNRQVRLSQAAIDVLAIVAYNQPIPREQVEVIRGKPSGSVLAQLVRRNLLDVEPDPEQPKMRYYTTTDKFLDLFQLDDLADLPQSHDVSDIAELAD